MDKKAPLDSFLDSNGFDGFLLREDSSSSNLYYLTELEVPDPVIFLRTRGKSILVVSQLEYSRAKEEAKVDEVISSSEFLSGESRNDENATVNTIVKLLERFEIRKLAVPDDFPLGLYTELEDELENLEIEPIEDRVTEARKIKSEKEIEKLKKAQKVTEEVMERVESIIQESNMRDGKLFLEDKPLTSERVKKKIKPFLLENDCSVPEETIVACGKDSAKPHSTGSGVLEPNKPIVVDIFPKHKSRYFGDMTRTFVKGEARKETKDMKKAVLKAQEAAFEVLDTEETVKASEVHNKVCDVLESHGYDTLRDKEVDEGFIHSTGHAVGLELHETPRIADNDDELEPGMILTIEPGLYYSEHGGIRIEDMVLVTEDGFENFNSMHKELEIE